MLDTPSHYANTRGRPSTWGWCPSLSYERGVPDVENPIWCKHYLGMEAPTSPEKWFGCIVHFLLVQLSWNKSTHLLELYILHKHFGSGCSMCFTSYLGLSGPFLLAMHFLATIYLAKSHTSKYGGGCLGDHSFGLYWSIWTHQNVVVFATLILF